MAKMVYPQNMVEEVSFQIRRAEEAHPTLS